MPLLDSTRSILVVIDLQGKLIGMAHRPALVASGIGSSPMTGRYRSWPRGRSPKVRGCHRADSRGTTGGGN